MGLPGSWIWKYIGSEFGVYRGRDHVDGALFRHYADSGTSRPSPGTVRSTTVPTPSPRTGECRTAGATARDAPHSDPEALSSSIPHEYFCVLVARVVTPRTPSFGPRNVWTASPLGNLVTSRPRPTPRRPTPNSAPR